MQPSTPTLLEVITQSEEKTRIVDAIAPVPDIQLDNRTISNANLFLIPSDDGLENANYKLASSGISLFILRNRLQPIANNFGVIIVDPPPERSLLRKTLRFTEIRYWSKNVFIVVSYLLVISCC